MTKQRYECIKVGYDGYPDRLIIHPDREHYFWIEFKTLTGGLRPNQIARIQNLECRGDTVLIVRSENELLGKLQEHGL